MTNSIVTILMGSSSDMSHAEKIGEALDGFGIAYDVIGSANKTPDHVLNRIETYENDPRPKAYVTIAEPSNALTSFTDVQVTAPVIASGAALPATKIIALFNEDVRAKLIAKHQAYFDTILADDIEVNK